MKLNQLQFLDNGHLPSDLSNALVIDSNNLDRLQARIKELQIEKASEKKLFKQEFIPNILSIFNNNNVLF